MTSYAPNTQEMTKKTSRSVFLLSSFFNANTQAMATNAYNTN